MRKLIVFGLTIVIIGLAAASSSAQSSTDEWTGFYVGGYAGVTNARPGVNTTPVFSSSGYFFQTSVNEISADGARTLGSQDFTGGGQFGYNRRFGRFVGGAEIDFGAERVSGSQTVSRQYSCCPFTYTLTQEAKSNWLMTIRPRAGIAVGKALFYATGGLAVTDVKYSALFTDTLDALESGEIDKTRAGYTVGGGVEVRVYKNWSVKGEYLYNDFGRLSTRSTNFTTGGVADPNTVIDHSIEMKSHNVRFGVNYKF